VIAAHELGVQVDYPAHSGSVGRSIPRQLMPIEGPSDLETQGVPGAEPTGGEVMRLTGLVDRAR